MAETLLLRKQEAFDAPLPHKDYSMHLLQYAAERSLLPPDMLLALRDGLHTAAAERAAQYTAGKSTTVTRKQAEAFYASVFTQLDAVLLALQSDAAALEALRTKPLTDLLAHGAMMTLQAYETAKERFRRAYQLTKPVQTSFFRALLREFEQFCTKYDARFRATETHVAYSYPLLCGQQITENGAVGVCRYYTALCREGEFLHLFPADDIRAMMTRYAARFLTSPDMIAENIAELVLRHWAVRLLCGQEGFSAAVRTEMIEAVQAEYRACPAEQLADMIRQRTAAALPAQETALTAYLTENLPGLSALLHARIIQERLDGWLAPDASGT